MATNQTGIAIVIKAWLPVTGTLSEQIASLQMVEAAHTSGDYAELLKASSVDEIKTEQKTRRIEDVATTAQPTVENTDTPVDESGETSGMQIVDVAEEPEQTENAEPAPRRRKAAAE